MPGISTATWGGMLALKNRITAYCDPCKRSVEIDASKFPPDENAIGRTWRCSVCGGIGRCIVSSGVHNPSNQMMGPDFYGKPPTGPTPEPIVKRRRRKR